MFSENLKEYACKKYEERLAFYGACGDEIEEKMALLTEDERILMKFFYGTMPLSDAGDYGFETFLGFVRHSLMLRENIDRCRDLPEDIFVTHVLYYRINSERIEDCRRFFYDLLIDRIRGMSTAEAVLEINYWCAENGTYEDSDRRTEPPMTFYSSGKGRCGEESTFAVTAFRSVGIPARQVYTPRWAHCDSNHAWVEVYIDGNWHFLGACEPEEVLDRGWFSNASSRAMLVHTRTFSDYQCDITDSLGKEEGVCFHNRTSAYAKTKDYVINVRYDDMSPAAGARIACDVLNFGDVGPIATLYADGNGKAVINCGLGDLLISAWKDGYCCEAKADVKNTDSIDMILKPAVDFRDTGVWFDEDIAAPEEYPMNPSVLTREQKTENRKRSVACALIREERIGSCYKEEYGRDFPEEEEIFRLAGGNAAALYSFLKTDDDPDRRAILHSLAPKDWRDVKTDVLESCLENASRYRREWCEKGLRDIYEKYILCPRVRYEELSCYPDTVNAYFDEEQKELFREDPLRIWSVIRENISYVPELDYGTIVSTPAGTLKLGEGNPESRQILFVAICRTLGIPARINPVDREAEYYSGEGFVPAGGDARERDNSALSGGRVRFVTDEPEHWAYRRNWAVARLTKEDRFETLNYFGLTFPGKELDLELAAGTYRVVTSTRLPNGNQLASFMFFTLGEDENLTVRMRLRTGSLDELTVSNEIDDFYLEKDSVKISASDIADGGPCVFAFLSEGEEPTEHVLNEMLEEAEALSASGLKISFILRSPDSLKNSTLGKVLEAIPHITAAFGDFDEITGPVARRMYVDNEKLPLLVLTDKGLHGIYGCSGYNAGSVDLILKLAGLCGR